MDHLRKKPSQNARECLIVVFLAFFLGMSMTTSAQINLMQMEEAPDASGWIILTKAAGDVNHDGVTLPIDGIQAYAKMDTVFCLDTLYVANDSTLCFKICQNDSLYCMTGVAGSFNGNIYTTSDTIGINRVAFVLDSMTFDASGDSSVFIIKNVSNSLESGDISEHLGTPVPMTALRNYFGSSAILRFQNNTTGFDFLEGGAIGLGAGEQMSIGLWNSNFIELFTNGVVRSTLGATGQWEWRDYKTLFKVPLAAHRIIVVDTVSGLMESILPTAISGDDWGSDVVNTDITLLGDGTIGNELGADTSGGVASIATQYYVDLNDGDGMFDIGHNTDDWAVTDFGIASTTLGTLAASTGFRLGTSATEYISLTNFATFPTIEFMDGAADAGKIIAASNGITILSNTQFQAQVNSTAELTLLPSFLRLDSYSNTRDDGALTNIAGFADASGLIGAYPIQTLYDSVNANLPSTSGGIYGGSGTIFPNANATATDMFTITLPTPQTIGGSNPFPYTGGIMNIHSNGTDIGESILWISNASTVAPSFLPASTGLALGPNVIKSGWPLIITGANGTGSQANINIGGSLLAHNKSIQFNAEVAHWASGLQFLNYDQTDGTDDQVWTHTVNGMDWVDIPAIGAGDGGIYEGSGTVPTTTVATIIDSLEFVASATDAKFKVSNATVSFEVGKILDFGGTLTDGIRLINSGSFGHNLYFQNSTTGGALLDGASIGIGDSEDFVLGNWGNLPINFFTNSITRHTIESDGQWNYPAYSAANFTTTSTDYVMVIDSATQDVFKMHVDSFGTGGSSAVTTDATLTGDGTGGDPLKVDTSLIATQYYVDANDDNTNIANANLTLDADRETDLSGSDLLFKSTTTGERVTIGNDHSSETAGGPMLSIENTTSGRYRTLFVGQSNSNTDNGILFSVNNSVGRIFYTFQASYGTKASPTDVPANKNIALLHFLAYNTGGYKQIGNFWFETGSTWSSSSYHGKLIWKSYEANSTTRVNMFVLDGSDSYFPQNGQGNKTGTETYLTAWDTDGKLLDVPLGSDNQVFTMNGTVPGWEAASGSSEWSLVSTTLSPNLAATDVVIGGATAQGKLHITESTGDTRVRISTVGAGTTDECYLQFYDGSSDNAQIIFEQQTNEAELAFWVQSEEVIVLQEDATNFSASDARVQVQAGYQNSNWIDVTATLTLDKGHYGIWVTTSAITVNLPAATNTTDHRGQEYWIINKSGGNITVDQGDNVGTCGVSADCIDDSPTVITLADGERLHITLAQTDVGGNNQWYTH